MSPFLFKGVSMLALSSSQLILGCVIIFIGFSIYQIYSLKDKIHCTFIKEDRTTIERIVKAKAGRIVFDGGWYKLDINRTTQKLKWIGIFPTWMRCLIYRFDSPVPLDPADWHNDFKPEDRKALDRSDDIRALVEKSSGFNVKGGSNKKTFLESITPILTIAGFLILGYLIWKMQGNIDMLGNGQNYIESQLDQLIGR